MCGGIVASFGRIPKEELKKIYSEREIERFQKSGKFESHFWDKKPVLPIFEDNNIKLKTWGNRDKDAPFPKTGWAKKESIEHHKWDHFTPKPVKIVAEEGIEKGKHFKAHDFAGILIEKGGDERVYMITEPANDKYLKMTGHDRMPIEVKSNKGAS